MKKLIIIPALLFCVAAIGQATKKTFELPEFKGIYVNSGYTVYLKQTNKQEVIAEADADILSITNILVENGILMINMEKKPETGNKSVWSKIEDLKVNPTMKVYVSVRDINELQVNGSGKIISENSLASNNLNLLVSGSGEMNVDIKGDELTAEVTGAGSLIIKGYASNLNVRLSGSGSLKAFNCPVPKATITLSGSGEAEVNVEETLNASITGSGNIRHKGNTKSVVRKIYGSGTIARAY